MKLFNLKDYDDKKIINLLLIISLFFTMLIGISLTYNYDFTNTFDLLFQSDTARVIGDITDLSYSHMRLNVHPLFVLLVTPIYHIIKGFIINKMLSLVILSSLVTSLSVVFIYKILSIYNKDKTINVILCLCYLFAFSNYIFTSGIEIYNIASLFLIILWYYVLKKENEQINDRNIFIFVVLGVLSAGFTITNIIVFGICLFILLLFKKAKFSQLLTIIAYTLFILIDLVFFQNIVWHNTPGLSINNLMVEKSYTSFDVNFNKISNVIREDYFHSMIANDVYVKLESDNSNAYFVEPIIHFDNNTLIMLFTSIFFIILILLCIKNYKNNKFANTGLLLTLLFNTILHILYGNECSYVYSLHFLYLFILLFGINFSYEKNEKLKRVAMIYLIILMVFELLINNIIFIKVLRIVESILSCNYYVSIFGLTRCILFTILFLVILFFLIYLLIKRIRLYDRLNDRETKIKHGLILVVIILIIHSFFIGLETSEYNKKIIIWEIKQEYDKNKYIDSNKYVKYDNNDLKEKFGNEINALNDYKNEYELLKKKYPNKQVKYLNNDNYYLFGFGNRNKIIYKDSKLIEIDTNKVLYSFNVLEELIIPNLYTVLLKTTEGYYIKIYEDENGIHLNKNDIDILIDGTNIKIDLYNFENQKYKNTLKVLYGEILFNIKDSVIYPNIFVYNKPWYRDAALACMVLKKTNNTNMIREWVTNIDSIYDYQNKGIKEVDNLGELLYILSTQDEINSDLVEKIEKEADFIVRNNSKGNYLIGMTDFKNRPLYQNLWYKLGIESIGKEFKYNINNINDDYANTAWWIDNKSKSTINISNDYPYLNIANYHNTNKGKIVINSNIYPLSWEKNASEANYHNLELLGNYYVENKISPTHIWTASELFLLLFDN